MTIPQPPRESVRVKLENLTRSTVKMLEAREKVKEVSTEIQQRKGGTK